MEQILTDDGENYEYVYDAFGRLNQVKDESTGNVISEYRYYGNGHRASAVNDADSDNDLGDEMTEYLYHNERWQLVATFHGDDP